MTSILYGLVEVFENCMPKSKKRPLKSPPSTPPVAVLTKSTTHSPTILKESTLESTSEHTPPISTQEKLASDNVKLTAWIQWTITRFTLKLYSHSTVALTSADMSYVQEPTLKLTVEAEDIVSSLDFQSVYLKIKSKVGLAKAMHFER